MAVEHNTLLDIIVLTDTFHGVSHLKGTLS
nr:MAG TPA: hypothetical protein [Bacteriophage sp.]